MKFSIIIPAYKALYLEESIKSIISQTYKDFELIIVNDASPEDLDKIVHSFQDRRIKYYKNTTNCGALNVVDNWNICLSHVSGDYVICMGDDDKLLPNCLEEYRNLIIQYPNKGVYHSWTEIIDEHSNIIKIQEPRPLVESVYSMIWNRWNGRIQFIGDFLFNVKTLKKNGGFYKLPMAWGTDDITAFIAAKDTGIANTQIPGFQYRINSRTISNTGNIEQKLNAITLEQEWYEKFLSYEPDEQNLISHIYWKMCIQYLPKIMYKKKIKLISKDISKSKIKKMIKYFHLRRKYSISLKMLFISLVLSFKNN